MKQHLLKALFCAVVAVCLVGCGTPPTVVHNTPVQTKTPITSQQNEVSEPDATTEDVLLSYETEQSLLQKEPTETMLYTIDFDAQVSRLVSSTLPNITVRPRSLRDAAEAAILPEDYVLYYTQQHYYARCIVHPMDITAEFDANANNRWDEDADYPGVLTEEALIEHAYQWAQTLGIDIDSVAQTAAYGKHHTQNRVQSFFPASYYNKSGS